MERERVETQVGAQHVGERWGAVRGGQSRVGREGEGGAWLEGRVERWVRVGRRREVRHTCRGEVGGCEGAGGRAGPVGAGRAAARGRASCPGGAWLTPWSMGEPA